MKKNKPAGEKKIESNPQANPTNQANISHPVSTTGKTDIDFFDQVNSFVTKITSNIEARRVFVGLFIDELLKRHPNAIAGLLLNQWHDTHSATKFYLNNTNRENCQHLPQLLAKELGLINTPSPEFLNIEFSNTGSSNAGSSNTQSSNTGASNSNDLQPVTTHIWKIGESGFTYGAFLLACNKPLTSNESLFYDSLAKALLPVFKCLLVIDERDFLRYSQQVQSSIDPETGLYNLEFLIGFLQQQLLFSFRQKSPVGLLILDVDHFEHIKEEHGLPIAAKTLNQIASHILKLTRASDLMARYGPDEIAVVLPNTDLPGARVLAEKLRLEIQQLNLLPKAKGKSGKATVSVGCAAFDMNDLNPETILRNAKLALMQAKNEGRNKVCTH